MRVVITNTVALNGGDAAILLGIRRILSHALGGDTEFVVLDSRPEIARRLYPSCDFRPALFRRAEVAPGPFRRLRASLKRGLVGHLGSARDVYRRADLIVSTGGTYLVERFDLSARRFELSVATRSGTPLVFFTQSLGPFQDPRNREVLARVFGRARLILLRDERSRRALLELGVPAARTAIAADAAFALADPGRADDGDRGASCGNRPPRIAISVREGWHGGNGDAEGGMAAYRAALGELTRHLVDDLDAEVTYVSTCQGVPEYWTDDSLVAATVLESLPGAYRKRVRIDGAFHRPDELVELLGGHDVVVSTRMHGAILSLVAGTPAIAIAYEPKTRALYDRLGLSEWTVGVEALDGEGLAGILRSLLARLPEHRARLSEIVAREYRSAMRSGETVRRALAGEDG